MSFLIFAGALLFFIYPNVSKKGISFVDLYILFCLYFDAMLVFTGRQIINFMYFQNFLVLVFSLFYYTNNVKIISIYHKKISFATISFLLIILLLPIIRGADINQTVRNFSMNYTSLIILPISFHYYSQVGNIQNLLRSGYFYIVLDFVCNYFYTFRN